MNDLRVARSAQARSRMLGGITLRLSSPSAARDELISLAKSPLTKGMGVHLVNAYTIALAHRDVKYAALLNGASSNFPDGKPLAWATRFSRSPLRQVRGPGLFEDILECGRSQGVKHYLLGSTPTTLELLEKALLTRFPDVQIVGKYSPPFRDLTEQELSAQDRVILESQAEIVWVGLGTPKQDYETERIARSIPVVVCAVGAAFDFSAGTKKQAPRWMTVVGLEWLYRFGSEPRRLWRRYLIGNTVFIAAVWKGRRSS